MALANKGFSLYHYIRNLFNEVHTKIFMAYSYHFFERALKGSADIHPVTEQQIRSFKKRLETYITVEVKETPPNLNDYPLGDNLSLKNYRLWVLENAL